MIQNIFVVFHRDRALRLKLTQFYWNGPKSKLRVVLSANIISTFTKPCIAAEELKSIGHKIGLQTCLYILKIDKVRLNLLTYINYIFLFAQLIYSFCPQKPFLSNKISERNASYHARCRLQKQLKQLTCKQTKPVFSIHWLKIC